MTAAIPVNVRRVEGSERSDRFRRAVKPLDLEGDLRRARVLANWLDAQFSIGTFRFGMDAVVGLVPVVGDTLGAIAGLYPIYLARKHKLGKGVATRMAANVLI